MENGTAASASYVNGTTSKQQPSQQQQPQLANAVSMESLDSAISTSNGGSGGPDAQTQVRTLFVSGLPADVKPRELYLLFRAYPGYEASQLKLTPSSKNGLLKSSTPVGFVTFATRQDADEARQKLQGVRFDPEQPQAIRLELARSNTKVTKLSKQPSPPNHLSPSTTNLSAILPPPAPVFPHNIAVAQLAALQQQHQFAAAVLLNQQQQHNQHHENSASAVANSSVISHQQQLLAAALNDQQRHLTPLFNGTADVHQQLAALAAVQNNPTAALAAFNQQAAQAQAVQQLFQQQQQQSGNSLLLAGLPVVSSAQMPMVAALAAAQQQQQQHLTSVANGLGGAGHLAWTSTAGAGQQQQAGQQQLTNNAPCSTVFVGNLGQAATSSPGAVEEELKGLFGMFPGFSRLRMHAKNGAPVAFVEFNEVGQAMAAMQAMQGYALNVNGGAGAGGGGIRIEFAKTRMGKTGQQQQKEESRN